MLEIDILHAVRIFLVTLSSLNNILEKKMHQHLPERLAAFALQVGVGRLVLLPIMF